MKPPWLIRAIGEMNVAETPGGNNARIIEYDSETTLKATDQSVPWCSSFLCWCFEREGIPSTRSAAARSWLTWGVAIGRGIQGCVVIISRGTGNQAHCGLWWSEDRDMVYLLSGNVSNKVCVMGFARDRVLGYRVPSDEYWIAVKNEDDSLN